MRDEARSRDEKIIWLRADQTLHVLSEENLHLLGPQTDYLLMMDSFRFGEDYHNRFDPKAYLNYYNGAGDKLESYGEFSLRCFHEFWSKLAKRNAKSLT